MARLEDPEILARLRAALSNWRVTGYVLWKDLAQQWVRSQLDGVEPREVARLMHDHVVRGGAVDQVNERRPEWSDYDFHYDFRLPVAGRHLYIETVLLDDDPEDPILRVVSIHDV